MASLATIPTMFLGADVLGMPSIALARYSKAPHQLPNFLGARKIERRLRLDDDHDSPEREGGR